MITRLMAFAGGALLGGGITAIVMEKARRDEVVYQFIECERDHAVNEVEAPAETEEELGEPITGLDEILATPISIVTRLGDDQVIPDQRVGDEDKDTKNPYHVAVAATVVPTPIETFVAGDVNEFGMSYLEEEDFLDEDGRMKNRIDIFITDGSPIFVLEGEQIEDWADRIGANILLDMYKLVPPGLDKILYVRNNRTDEDYEVVCV